MSFDISSLTANELLWDEVGVCLAAFVALGVALEAIDDIEKLADWLKLNTLEGSRRRKKIARLGLAILVVALAFEVGAAMKSHDISQQIIAGLSGEITETQSREQHLIDQSNELTRTVKYLTTDRAISVQRVANKLGGFGKIPFVLAVSDDREAIQLAGQIADALVGAGWDWKDNKRSDNAFEQGRSFPSKPFMRVQPARGIAVNIAIADGTRLSVAARALADALMTEQLRDVEEQDLDGSMMEAGKKIYGVVHITVGTRQ